MVRLVRAVKQHGSLSHVVEVFRGANIKAVKDRGHNSLPDHGAGKALRCVLLSSRCSVTSSNAIHTSIHMFNEMCAHSHVGA